MPKPRIELQALLENVLGSRNVYFQPPESVKLKYPAIVYSLSTIESRFADNSAYSRFKTYQITVIDTNPDSDIRDRVSELPMCRFRSSYTADRLNHYVFSMYY